MISNFCKILNAPRTTVICVQQQEKGEGMQQAVVYRAIQVWDLAVEVLKALAKLSLYDLASFRGTTVHWGWCGQSVGTSAGSTLYHQGFIKVHGFPVQPLLGILRLVKAYWDQTEVQTRPFALQSLGASGSSWCGLCRGSNLESWSLEHSCCWQIIEYWSSRSDRAEKATFWQMSAQAFPPRLCSSLVSQWLVDDGLQSKPR